jgi:hypothetical protein
MKRGFIRPEADSQPNSSSNREERRTLTVRAGLWITKTLKAIFFFSVNRVNNK